MIKFDILNSANTWKGLLSSVDRLGFKNTNEKISVTCRMTN